MKITEQQWDMINEEQKRVFVEELGKDFGNGVYPNMGDFLTFLGNNGYKNTGFKTLTKYAAAPTRVKEVDELWEDVVDHFTSEEE